MDGGLLMLCSIPFKIQNVYHIMIILFVKYKE